MSLSGRHIHIKGVVQGVGFRPFVYSLASELELAGSNLITTFLAVRQDALLSARDKLPGVVPQKFL